MWQSKSHYENLRESLVAKLKDAKVDLDVVTMPDFFLDHSLACNFDARSLTRRILSVASRGGGEIPEVPQSFEVGGNAAICTLALAKLGVNVHPIMKTDALGLSFIRYFYRDPTVDLAGVKSTGSLSPTTILEFRQGKSSTNVMLGDISSITPFTFEDLDSRDLAIIARARYVCVFNWVYNRRGTDLAEGVFTYCRRHSNTLTFFDASDPRPRIEELADLDKRVLRNGLIDVLGVNENEALVFARLYDRKMKRENNIVLQAGKVISDNTGAEIRLHTADYSASIREDGIVIIPAFSVTPRRGTGAGDSWNAGSIAADALELTEEERLLFANAVAARYVSNTKRVHSTLSDVIEFLQDASFKLKRIKGTRNYL